MSRPTHTPTKTDRKAVQMYAAFGTTHEAIARIIGIDAKTLRKHYRDELDLGKDRMIGSVAGALYKKAMTGDVGACCFILKTQGGWRETNRTEHTSPDGTMTPTTIIIKAADGPGGD